MIKEISITLCILQLSACTSIQSSHLTSPQTQDSIIAIGTIANNQQNKIVFSGNKYTYVADQGGEIVFKIIEKTEADKRSVINRLPIEFKMVSKTDFITTLNIRYDIPITQLNSDEFVNLKKLGFNKSSYNCKTSEKADNCKYPLAEINLRGRIYEKDPNEIPYKLKQPYPIYITEKDSINTKKVGNKTGNVLKTIAIAPLAAVGVILYIPVVLTFGLFSIGNPDAWH